jgi:N-acetylmuramoyl-L-alanine amidase
MKKPTKKVLSFIFVCLYLITIVFSFNVVEAYSRWGSRGAEVTEIQTRLKNWGYYGGAIDSIYGSATTAAVRLFQQRNGLYVDGICGTQTLRALGINPNASTGTSNRTNDLALLARAVYSEARGEPYIGQVAIAAVVLNRVKHPSFPNTIAGVIYQPGAFTAVSDGQINLAPDDTARRAAQDAMNGYDPSHGCIYYYNPATATNKWIFSRPVALRIGKHVFAR